jgi:Mrp family chromosome partitioning ATPase/uncharacterized protein involved in exopolysaccharide biosynthesis
MNQPRTTSQANPPPVGLSPHEVFYILYRHRKLICVISTVGIVLGVATRFLWPMPYESDASVMIKYIRETQPPVQVGSDAPVKSIVREENIINSELSILSSYDLATNVVGILKPEKILKKEGGGTNKNEAALLVRKNLKVNVAPKSDVIELSFYHHDPDMASLILGQVIESYIKRHGEVHRPEFNEFLTRETEDLKSKLRDTDAQLREAKKKGNVQQQLDDSERNAGASLTRIQQQIYDAEAEWAGYRQTLAELQTLIPKSATPTLTAPSNAPSAPQTPPVPSDKVAEYQRVREQLSSLESDQQKLLLVYTTNNSLVQTNQALISKNERVKHELESQFPGLLAIKAPEAKYTPQAAAPPPGFDPELAFKEEAIKADALAAKIRVLTNQLAEVKASADTMNGMEGTIVELQRVRDQEQASLEFYLKKLDENSADAVFAEGNSNIAQLQAPTPAMRDETKLNKWMLEIIIGGLVVALGIPFLIELVLDRSLKQPADVKSNINLPFFINIPYLNGNGKTRSLKRSKRRRMLVEPSIAPANPPGSPEMPNAPAGGGSLALWQERPALQPFYETLRDRLMTFFEMINLTHKPKLVAVTSCSSGAGVTATAAGLASSLSETGDGNVLLVNMNVRDGEAHHFYKGKLNCGLDEVLEKGAHENACVQGNLYVAKEQPEDDRLPRVLPKRFSHLLPKMKASDFDYIIFDMPPVSQISITPRLARFMDMVLLVIESGKTDRDAAKRVAALLSESKANVGVVLNKNQTHLPGNRQHDV